MSHTTGKPQCMCVRATSTFSSLAQPDQALDHIGQGKSEAELHRRALTLTTQLLHGHCATRFTTLYLRPTNISFQLTHPPIRIEPVTLVLMVQWFGKRGSIPCTASSKLEIRTVSSYRQLKTRLYRIIVVLHSTSDSFCPLPNRYFPITQCTQFLRILSFYVGPFLDYKTIFRISN